MPTQITDELERLQRENQQLQKELKKELNRSKLEAACTPEIIHHYEVTCPECGNYYPGHATGGSDICTCKTKNPKPWKEEDPRMLREQIRVADLAYNRLNEENQQLQREVESSKVELKLLVAGLKGALYGLSTHPVTVDFQGFCISEKSKEKLTCIHEMIARYEHL